MNTSDWLKMNLPGYEDSADILKVTENFQKLDGKYNELDERLKALEGDEPEKDKAYIYYGANAASVASASIVKGLTKKYTNNPYGDITVSMSNEYCYFALPVDFGTVQFETVGTGGFENPVTIRIDTDDYRVYRSTHRLDGTVTIKVKA